MSDNGNNNQQNQNIIPTPPEDTAHAPLTGTSWQQEKSGEMQTLESDEMQVLESNEVLSGDVVDGKSSVGIRRAISDALRKAGDSQAFIQAMGRKMSYREYLGIMVWDLLSNGEFLFADGTKLQLSDTSEWVALLKFVANHMDGPVTGDTNIGLNIFKVYMGIDQDKV